MFGYYLKTSAKVLLWHIIAQFLCFCIGFIPFGAIAAKYRIVEVLVSVGMTVGYAMYMYSKFYKVGERDTKSFAEEKPYVMKGAVLCILLLLVSLLLAIIYDASFSANSWLMKFVGFFPFRFWGYAYIAFIKAADGSVAPLYWVLYFGVSLLSCAGGYISGMHRWELGYNFFKNLVYKKKNS